MRANQRQLHDLGATMIPALLDEPGVGAVSAAHLIVAWSHPGRCRSESAFASLAGVSPIEASSGRVTRHRLNRFGDANSTGHCTPSSTGAYFTTTNLPRTTSPAGALNKRPTPRSVAASSATPHDTYSGSWKPPRA
jgi:hypothetical protein